MDSQTAINALFSLLGILVGLMLKAFNDNIKSLQRTDAELATKVQAIEVLVAGHYVKRDDMEKLSAAIFTKLDRIESKLDGKADK